MTVSTLLVIVLLTNLLVTPLYAQASPMDVIAASVGAFAALTDVEQLVEKNLPQNVFSQGNFLLVAITIINDTPYEFTDFKATAPSSNVADYQRTKTLMQPQSIVSGGTGVAVYRKLDIPVDKDMIDLELSFNVYFTDGSRINLVYQLIYKDDGSNPFFSLKASTDTPGGGRELKAGAFGTAKIPLGSNFGCRHWMNDRVEVALHFVTDDLNIPDTSLKDFTNDTYHIGTQARVVQRLTDQDYNSDSQCAPLARADRFDRLNELPAQQQMFWIKRLFGGDFIIYNALTYRALSWDSKSKLVQSCRPPQANLDAPLPLEYRWTISYHPDTYAGQAPMLICTQGNANLCLYFADSGGWSLVSFAETAEENRSNFAFFIHHTDKGVKETPDDSVTTFNIIYADKPTMKVWASPSWTAMANPISERPTDRSAYSMHFVADGAYYKIFAGFTQSDAPFLSVPSQGGIQWAAQDKKYPRDQRWTLTKSNTEPPFYIMQNEAYGCFLAKVDVSTSYSEGPHEQMDAVVDDHEQKDVEEDFFGAIPYFTDKMLSCEPTIPPTNYRRFKWKLDFVN